MPLTKLSSALYNMGGSDVGWHTERYCTDVSLRELLEAGGQKRALKLNLQSKGCGCPGCRTFAWEAWEEHGRSMGYGHSSLDQFCCFFLPLEELWSVHHPFDVVCIHKGIYFGCSVLQRERTYVRGLFLTA